MLIKMEVYQLPSEPHQFKTSNFMAIRNIPNIVSEQAALQNLYGKPQAPLDALIQGIQQGVALEQLPQQLQNQALSNQIAQALQQAKLQQLQTGEVQNVGGRLVRYNPQTGQTEIILDAAPPPVTYQSLGFDPVTKLPVSFNPRTNTYSSPTGTLPSGPLIPKVAIPDSLTPEGLLVNRLNATMRDVNSGDQTLANQIQTRKDNENAAKLAAQQEILGQKQDFTAEQNQLNRENQQTLAERRLDAQSAKDKASGTQANNQQYLIDTSDTIISTIDRLRPQVNNTTVGMGSLTSIIPGSPAKDFQAQLKVLSSGIFRQQLQAMRASSKTGGAVGNVSNKEGDRFENALGALDQAQSVPSMLKQLDIISDSTKKYKEAIQKSPNSAGGAETTESIGELLKSGQISQEEALTRFRSLKAK